MLLAGVRVVSPCWHPLVEIRVVVRSSPSVVIHIGIDGGVDILGPSRRELIHRSCSLIQRNHIPSSSQQIANDDGNNHNDRVDED